MLSTPIAYVNNADAIDVFAPPGSTQIVRGFRYVNIQGTYVQSALPARVAASGAYINYIGYWQLSSFGPDKIASTTDPAYNTFWVLKRYDPTNGTVSEGDIIRTQKSADGSYPAPI